MCQQHRNTQYQRVRPTPMLQLQVPMTNLPRVASHVPAWRCPILGGQPTSWPRPLFRWKLPLTFSWLCAPRSTHDECKPNPHPTTLPNIEGIRSLKRLNDSPCMPVECTSRPLCDRQQFHASLQRWSRIVPCHKDDVADQKGWRLKNFRVEAPWGSTCTTGRGCWTFHSLPCCCP